MTNSGNQFSLRPATRDLRPRILHLASGNRWTGAAAPAFAEVEALREAGVDAHYAFVGGYKLEAKIGHLDYAHGIIEKAQNPAAFARSVRALVALGAFDVIHAHLTYDHWLARFVARRTGARIARTFHSRRVIRSDPFTRSLIASTPALFVVNATFDIRGRHAVFTPPPIDHRQFTTAGENARALYGIDRDTPLVTVIGKLAAGRGFETALRAFASIRAAIPRAKMMIIGHGEHRAVLESLSRDLGIESNVIWAGYHEDDLAAHYRASDLLLFTARGSDEGHRAILEAMACGVPPVTAPIDGVGALVRGFEQRFIAASESPDAIASAAIALLPVSEQLREDVAAHSQQFGFFAAASHLLDAYRVVKQ
jgi:glycosyltransferase involved in cell wall biosynthesis